MNGDRGEGFEGDFAACRRINVSLRIATSVSGTASHAPLGIRSKGEDEAVVILAGEKELRNPSQRMVASLARRPN